MSVGLLPVATPEQEMLLDASTRFIETALPLAGVRALVEEARPGGAGATAGPTAGSTTGPVTGEAVTTGGSAGQVDPGYGETAASLGWFGLLVDERHGGGSVSGNGLLDAAAIAAERGAALQPGPFVATSVVAYALARAAGDRPDGHAHRDPLDRLLAGRASATWVAGAVGGLTPGAGTIVARADGDGHVLSGTVRHVPEPVGRDLLLVTAEGPTGLAQFLVDAAAGGVDAWRLESLDLTRPAGAVRLRDVRVGAQAVVGTPGVSSEELFDRQVAIAAVLTAAESVGAMHSEFSLALQYAKTRVAFGRPIGSFQSIKHLLAETSLSLEMAMGLVALAAEALGADASNGPELAHAAKAFVAERGVELAQACFQVFGGIGYTWEHDHHLFMRRLAADAEAFGSAGWHRARIGEGIGVG
jgi:alkylation response protein AidB-like acyl-CoA dehydrogenase